MEIQKAISDDIRIEIEALFQHLPYKKAACIDALRIVQMHNHWISDEAVKEIAALLEMTPAGVDSVATFYSMVYRQPVGRHVIHVCDSVSCWVMGCDGIMEYLRNKLGCDLGETTQDNRFTLLPILCLGNCDHAPTLLIDQDLYHDLEVDKLDLLLENYK